MSDIPALSIQGMAKKFVRGSIIEDAAAKLVSQIMTEVADAHIAPRDAEISRLTARIEDLENGLTKIADGKFDSMVGAMSIARSTLEAGSTK